MKITLYQIHRTKHYVFKMPSQGIDISNVKVWKVNLKWCEITSYLPGNELNCISCPQKSHRCNLKPVTKQNVFYNFDFCLNCSNLIELQGVKMVTKGSQWCPFQPPKSHKIYCKTLISTIPNQWGICYGTPEVVTDSPNALRSIPTHPSFGFFTISISDRKVDRRSTRQKNSGKINLLKSCLQWVLISQQQPLLLWSLTPNHLGHGVLCWMGDLLIVKNPIVPPCIPPCTSMDPSVHLSMYHYPIHAPPCSIRTF